MSSHPFLSVPAAGRLAVPSRQYYRSVSDSPARQQYAHHIDDLISQLGPTTAVQALRSPSGPLKECMATATTAEQAFAMRAARASSSIQGWLDELSRWPWPEHGGSAGFEGPAPSSSSTRPPTSGSVATRSDSTTQSLPIDPAPAPAATSTPAPATTSTPAPATATTSTPVLTEPALVSPEPASASRTPAPPAQTTPAAPVTPERQITRTSDLLGDRLQDESPTGRWMGSLPAGDVAGYDKRISEIRNEIDELEVEDLKRHVLHHYILPMSPPDTPSFVDAPLPSGSSRSSSSGSFARMDDLTAVVSAIVLQALPQLSKLDRLMNTWHIRLVVLKRIPRLLSALEAAEAVIQSAWHAVHLGADGTTNPLGQPSSDLRRDEFEMMRSVVQQKVSDAAQITDYILDSLDGREDTMPDAWIDRIDAAERKYTEWVSVCERKIREAEWRRAREAGAAPPQETATPEEPRTPESKRAISDDSDETGTSLESPSPEPCLPRMSISKPDEDGSKEGFPDIQWINSDGTSPDDDELAVRDSPTSSPPDFRSSCSRSAVSFGDMPTVAEVPSKESLLASTATRGATDEDAAADTSLNVPDVTQKDTPRRDTQEHGHEDAIDDQETQDSEPAHSRRESVASEDDQLQQQISEILESIPANIQLSSQPSPSYSHLNPPDFKLPPRAKSAADNYNTNTSNFARSTSSLSSRSGTPSFLLAPAYARTPRPRQQRGHQEIKLYHLSRSTGEAPIKLFIRLVGENGERVMVRVGGGWADLSEYLKEYASHHSRRSRSGGESKIEIRDLPTMSAGGGGGGGGGSRASSPVVSTPVKAAAAAAARVGGSSPPSRPPSRTTATTSRPPSALDYSPRAMTPLNVRKTRRSTGEEGGSNGINGISGIKAMRMMTPTTAANANAAATARTPLAASVTISADTPPSASTTRSRSSSHVSWTEEDSTLGMSGPRAKNIEMSEESKAWVESVKEKVRIASGERKASSSSEQTDGKFGELGKVGGTKRVFRRG